MSKPTKFVTPPWLNLKEALDLVQIIYEKGAGSLSIDDLARLMKSTVKSSAFGMKLVALRKFGLAQTDGHAMKLTDLATAIVAPSSPEEKQAAIVQSFNAIPLQAQLYQRYKGGYLPEDGFLANTLERECNVAPNDKEKWVECFKESGKAAGILFNEGGKVRVLQTPKPQGEPYAPPKPPMPPRIGEEWDIPPIPPKPLERPKSGDTFEVVLDDTRSVFLPKAFDREDLEYLQGVLDLYVKRRESKK